MICDGVYVRIPWFVSRRIALTDKLAPSLLILFSRRLPDHVQATSQFNHASSAEHWQPRAGRRLTWLD
jgi:hypothetical protein